MAKTIKIELELSVAQSVWDALGVALGEGSKTDPDAKDPNAEETDGGAEESTEISFDDFRNRCNAFKKVASADDLKLMLNHIGETDEKAQVGRMISAVDAEFYAPCMRVMDDWGIINAKNVAEVLGEMPKKQRKLILHDFDLKMKDVADLDDAVKIMKLYVAISTE